MSEHVAYGEETNAKPQPGVIITKVEGAPRVELRSPVARLLQMDAARAAIEPLLRPGDSLERVIVETYHAVRVNPKIAECEPASIVSSVAHAVETGLTIGVSVYLVPFFDKKARVFKCQSIIGYNGLIELVTAAGGARGIDAHCVYEHDDFSFQHGTEPRIHHAPEMDPEKRGNLIAAYSIAWLSQTRHMAVVMHVKELEELRQKYSQKWKDGPMPYWWAQKTPTRRLVKMLPKNPKLARVFAMIEREEAEEADVAEPASAPQRIAAADPHAAAVEHWASQPSPYDESEAEFNPESNGFEPPY